MRGQHESSAIQEFYRLYRWWRHCSRCDRTTIDAGQFRKVCMVAVNTGTNSPAGNIYIQHSNDDSTWVNGVTAAVAGAETNLLEDDLYARYTRFFYDMTSGGASATIAVTYTLKS